MTQNVTSKISNYTHQSALSMCLLSQSSFYYPKISIQISFLIISVSLGAWKVSSNRRYHVCDPIFTAFSCSTGFRTLTSVFLVYFRATALHCSTTEWIWKSQDPSSWKEIGNFCCLLCPFLAECVCVQGEFNKLYLLVRTHKHMQITLRVCVCVFEFGWKCGKGFCRTFKGGGVVKGSGGRGFEQTPLLFHFQ